MLPPGISTTILVRQSGDVKPAKETVRITRLVVHTFVYMKVVGPREGSATRDTRSTPRSFVTLSGRSPFLMRR